jgi:hypothetical protein
MQPNVYNFVISRKKLALRRMYRQKVRAYAVF